MRHRGRHESGSTMRIAPGQGPSAPVDGIAFASSKPLLIACFFAFAVGVGVVLLAGKAGWDA